ncbi:hypothetical protein ACTHGU_12180 [Chitinophagaceae bacterium MMS25-I14]
MSHIITAIGLILFHFITGYGLLRLFNIRQKPLAQGALAVICGVAIASVVPFLLQLCYIAITPGAIFTSWAVIAVLLNIRTIAGLKNFSFKNAFQPLPRIRIYEVPALLMLGFLLVVSIWRCYYYPSYVRDVLSGPEAIAEYAVKEHSLINSIFSVNLETTNNQFKSPYITDLQVIYKMAGFPFGAVWLSMLVVSFFVFLYYALSEKVHPVISGILLIFFIATPEAYGYTFMYLFDYSNMIFLFLGFYYLFSYFRSRKKNEFYFSAIMMAISVYIRAETLVLAGMTLPAIIVSGYKAKEGYVKPLISFIIMMVISVLAYWLPTELYNNHYLPQHYVVGGQINKNIFNLAPFFTRFSDMNGQLLFGEHAMQLWNYYIYIFLILLIAELLFKRSLTPEARNWLYAVAVIYIGLPFMGFLFPLMDLNNTTKRGLFKILPLMLLYMGNNQLLTGLSAIFYKWENGEMAKKTPPPVAAKRSKK